MKRVCCMLLACALAFSGIPALATQPPPPPPVLKMDTVEDLMNWITTEDIENAWKGDYAQVTSLRERGEILVPSYESEDITFQKIEVLPLYDNPRRTTMRYIFHVGDDVLQIEICEIKSSSAHLLEDGLMEYFTSWPTSIEWEERSTIMYTGDIHYLIDKNNQGRTYVAFVKDGFEININCKAPWDARYLNALRLDLRAITMGGSFADVQPNDWCYRGVEYLAQSGVMGGTGAGAFSPNNVISRAELVTALYRMAGSPELAATDFSDIPDETWFSDAVAWATQNGFIEKGQDWFEPKESVSRQDLAVWLLRYLDIGGYDYRFGYGMRWGWNKKYAEAFEDIDQVADDAEKAMETMCRLGVLCGDDKRMLNPRREVTRAETAIMIYRLDRMIQTLLWRATW